MVVPVAIRGAPSSESLQGRNPREVEVGLMPRANVEASGTHGLHLRIVHADQLDVMSVSSAPPSWRGADDLLQDRVDNILLVALPLERAESR